MTPIISIKPLGFQWETIDPFLFCVHHEDYYPKGNEVMGPDESFLKGRQLGNDFMLKDGFRMYHGKKVPGFPSHPHRGFETVTIVRKGLVDHSDSLGAAGRYGEGDVQWMTAGSGIQHAEMFPLINKDKENTLELFQVWLNLPAKNKMVAPYFKMLWSDTIPHYSEKNGDKTTVLIEVIAGTIGSIKAPPPPPDSWAFNTDNEVFIWNIMIEAGATFKLPASAPGLNRTLYYYDGKNLTVGDKAIPEYNAVQVQSDAEVELKAGKTKASLLMLQGRPIKEPVVQYGPFVMNTKEEINKAFDDFYKTQFGGWPWPENDHVHPRTQGRFAKHADGRVEEKG